MKKVIKVALLVAMLVSNVALAEHVTCKGIDGKLMEGYKDSMYVRLIDNGHNLHIKHDDGRDYTISCNTSGIVSVCAYDKYYTNTEIHRIYSYMHHKSLIVSELVGDEASLMSCKVDRE